MATKNTETRNIIVNVDTDNKKVNKNLSEINKSFTQLGSTATGTFKSIATGSISASKGVGQLTNAVRALWLSLGPIAIAVGIISAALYALYDIIMLSATAQKELKAIIDGLTGAYEEFASQIRNLSFSWKNLTGATKAAYNTSKELYDLEKQQNEVLANQSELIANIGENISKAKDADYSISEKKRATEEAKKQLDILKETVKFQEKLVEARKKDLANVASGQDSSKQKQALAEAQRDLAKLNKDITGFSKGVAKLSYSIETEISNSIINGMKIGLENAALEARLYKGDFEKNIKAIGEKGALEAFKIRQQIAAEESSQIKGEIETLKESIEGTESYIYELKTKYTKLNTGFITDQEEILKGTKEQLRLEEIRVKNENKSSNDRIKKLEKQLSLEDKRTKEEISDFELSYKSNALLSERNSNLIDTNILLIKNNQLNSELLDMNKKGVSWAGKYISMLEEIYNNEKDILEKKEKTNEISIGALSLEQNRIEKTVKNIGALTEAQQKQYDLIGKQIKELETENGYISYQLYQKKRTLDYESYRLKVQEEITLEYLKQNNLIDERIIKAKEEEGNNAKNLAIANAERSKLAIQKQIIELEIRYGEYSTNELYIEQKKQLTNELKAIDVDLKKELLKIDQEYLNKVKDLYSETFDEIANLSTSVSDSALSGAERRLQKELEIANVQKKSADDALDAHKKEIDAYNRTSKVKKQYDEAHWKAQEKADRDRFEAEKKYEVQKLKTARTEEGINIAKQSALLIEQGYEFTIMLLVQQQAIAKAGTIARMAATAAALTAHSVKMKRLGEDIYGVQSSASSGSGTYNPDQSNGYRAESSYNANSNQDIVEAVIAGVQSVPIYVSVKDINNQQNKYINITNNSKSF